MTVDERVAGIVGVVAAPWPTVDAGGLRFGGTISAAWFNEAELLAIVDRFRSNVDQLQRPLRIGDSFWVRGYSGSSLSEWLDLRDVTKQARAMAKAAVAAVAVGEVDQAPYRDDVQHDPAGQSETDGTAFVGVDQQDVPPPPGPATASPVL